MTFTYEKLIVLRKFITAENSSQKATVHCLFWRILSECWKWYLKGMLKLNYVLLSAKYCFIEWSRSLDLLDFLFSYVTYLKAFLIQYLTIYSFVFRNFLNFWASIKKICLSLWLSLSVLSASWLMWSWDNLEYVIR
jgi:hypothetical protein